MNKTRLSLLYLGSYLVLIGLGLLLVPHATFKILQSDRGYNDVMPRVAGMLMSGLGLSIFGMIRAHLSNIRPRCSYVRISSPA
jgi:hypothetical protein